MDDGLSVRKQIIDVLNGKSEEKRKCYKRTLEFFQMLKNNLHEISGEINDEVLNSKEIKVEYRDKGSFDAQLQFDEDLLLFNMHTNVFQFPEEHPVHSESYSKENPYNTLCGVVNVYNFLSESFKKNRSEDEGYLVARIFINRDGYFFADGEALGHYSYYTFGQNIITEDITINIIEALMLYSMEFELFVPSLETARIIEVEQVNTRMEHNKISTGKRLGYKIGING